MAQRLVLKAKDGTVPIAELKRFAEMAVLYGKNEKVMSSASYDLDSDGELRIMLTLPKNIRVVGNKIIIIKPKTKKQQAVDAQVAEHKEKKEKGEPEGYVPPVGRKTAPTPQKAKCPVCNTKKPVQTVNRIKIIKPHISKGEPCSGGGQQVNPKKGKK